MIKLQNTGQIIDSIIFSPKTISAWNGLAFAEAETVHVLL